MIVMASIAFVGCSQAADVKSQALMLGVLENYLAIQQKLAADTAAGVEEDAQKILRKISEALNKPCKPEEIACATVMQKISVAASQMKGTDIQTLRKQFVELSQAMVDYFKKFNPKWENVYAFECSMANDNKGAPWLQRGSSLKNPYFGKAMESCGAPIK